MAKKTLKIILVVFSICTIVFRAWTPAFAHEQITLSPYGSDGAGLGLTSYAGVQYLRGGLSNSSSGGAYALQDYFDVEVDSGTSISSFSGTGTNQSEGYYISYSFSGSTSGQSKYDRFLFPSSYLSTNQTMPNVFLQYMRYDKKTSSSTTSQVFTAGTTYYMHFGLYFSESTSVSNVSFRIGCSGQFTWSTLSPCYVYDEKSGHTEIAREYFPVTTNGVARTIQIEFDEPVSNFISFSLPFTIGSNYTHQSINALDGRHFYDVFRFYIYGMKNISGEAEEAQKAGDSASQDGTDAVPAEAAEDASASFSTLVSAMAYNGTEAKLVIPSFTWGLGNIIPERTWFEGATIDFGAYIQQFVPSSILAIIRAIGDITIVFFCAKELYNLISYVLVNRKADDTSDG